MENKDLLIDALLLLNSCILSIIAYFLKELKKNFDKRLDIIDEKIEVIKEKYVSKEFCSYHRQFIIEHNKKIALGEDAYGNFKCLEQRKSY